MFSGLSRNLIVLISLLIVAPSAHATVIAQVDVNYDIVGGSFTMQGNTVGIASGSYTVGFAMADSATNGPITTGPAYLRSVHVNLMTPLPLPTGFVGSTFDRLLFDNAAIPGMLLSAGIRSDGFITGGMGTGMGSVANGTTEAATFMVQIWFHDNAFLNTNRFLQVEAFFSDSFFFQVEGTEVGRTIVPEPTSGGLVFAGLVTVGVVASWARRRR